MVAPAVFPECRLRRSDGVWTGTYRAMASDCEVLMEVRDRPTAERILSIACAETRRIEEKFSRYRRDNIIHRINTSRGDPIEVDPETARLIDFADRLFELSGGKFDITSGALRRVWTFDGSDRLPDREEVRGILPLVGWHKVRWENPRIRLRPDMEIDLGGIGKEYAVDRCARLIGRETSGSCLVNFGGDLAVTGTPRPGGKAWRVGIESPTAGEACRTRILQLKEGGLATSGDARRFLLRNGVRYGHILDPETGWPIRDIARSITVAAGSCTDAGVLATLAILQGAGAESFLEAQGVRFWCSRS